MTAEKHGGYEGWVHFPSLDRHARRAVARLGLDIMRGCEGDPDADSPKDVWFAWARGLVHEHFEVPADAEVMAMRFDPERAGYTVLVCSADLDEVAPGCMAPDLPRRERWEAQGDPRPTAGGSVTERVGLAYVQESTHGVAPAGTPWKQLCKHDFADPNEAGFMSDDLRAVLGDDGRVVWRRRRSTSSSTPT